jgi:hypothetical protein
MTILLQGFDCCINQLSIAFKALYFQSGTRRPQGPHAKEQAVLCPLPTYCQSLIWLLSSEILHSDLCVEDTGKPDNRVIQLLAVLFWYSIRMGAESIIACNVDTQTINSVPPLH